VLSADEVKKAMEGTLIGATVAKKGKLTAIWGQIKSVE